MSSYNPAPRLSGQSWVRCTSNWQRGTYCFNQRPQYYCKRTKTSKRVANNAGNEQETAKATATIGKSGEGAGSSLGSIEARVVGLGQRGYDELFRLIVGYL